MTKWEYKWVRAGEVSPRIMNELGGQGWEFIGELGGDWLVFKKLVEYVTYTATAGGVGSNVVITDITDLIGDGQGGSS